MKLHVLSVLTAGECAVLRDAYDRLQHLSQDKDYSGWPVLRRHHFEGAAGAVRVLEKCEKAAVFWGSAFPGGALKRRVETTLLTAMGEGGHHIAHADNSRPVEGGWEPNHTPDRVMTAMVYLSSCGPDFTGGELVFPDWGVWVAPRAGQMVLFPSDKDHVHRVERVRDGKRYALSIWLAEDF